MAISAVSSNLVNDLLYQQVRNPFKAMRQDFQQLASALQSGDLSGAQSAYSAIQQLQANQGASASGTTSDGTSTLQNDFAALGQALQSGDLSDAQSAFAQFRTDLEAGGSAPSASGLGGHGQDQYVPGTAQEIAKAIQDYSQLTSSLQSGNLTDAQAAYTDLQQVRQAYQASHPNAVASGPNAIQSDFSTLGNDLQAGNLTQSQADFSQLQSDIQAALTAPTSADSGTTTQGATQATAQNSLQQVRHDYSELAAALQTGDLTSAQTAFNALQQALQTQSGSSSTASDATSDGTSSNDPIANDLNSLGQALSSGNLTQAQSAFSKLQSDIQSAGNSGAPTSGSAEAQRARGHHHHHHGGGGWYSSDQSSISTNTSSHLSVYA